MILADVNPVIHAYNTGFPNHTAARDWWEGALNGTEAVGLAWVTVLGFVRIMTHPRILQRPMTVEAASAMHAMRAIGRRRSTTATSSPIVR